MARKQPISPNQTVIWTYQALAPEWGSPALHDTPEPRKRPQRTDKKSSNAAPDRGTRKRTGRPGRKDRSASSCSILTAADGVCAQAKPSSCRVPGSGGRGPVRRFDGRG